MIQNVIVRLTHEKKNFEIFIGGLTDINDSLFGSVLSSVPVSPMAELFVLWFTISKDNTDH